MNVIRNGLVGAAVAVLLVLPTAATAYAAPPTTEIDVMPNNLQGWSVDTDTATTYAFVDTQHTLGTGSVRFGPISGSAPKDKFAIRHGDVIPFDQLNSISFDYLIDPSSPKATDPITPHRFYLNLYVDKADVTTPLDFFDCRYNYESTDPSPGWHTTTIQPTTAPPSVTPRTATITCPPTYGQLPAGSRIVSYALNGGDTSPPTPPDTSAPDAGLIGYFDKVVVDTASRVTTYDFEPAGGCAGTDGAIQNGNGRNENLRGTPGRDRIDGRDGNDTVDGRGGNDCLLGGAGNDQISAGAGEDEVQGGRGNDILNGDAGDDVITGEDGNDQITAGAGHDTVNGGAGNDQIDAGPGPDTIDAGAGNDIVRVRNGQKDTVDCGPGNDVVSADSSDTLRNCEARG